MTHAVDLPLIVITVSAFLYIALGTWIVTLTPLRRPTKLLGAFAILYGLIFAPLDVLFIFHLVEVPSLAQEVLQMPFSVLAWLGALALAASVPDTLEDRRLLALAVGIGVAVALDTTTYLLVHFPPTGIPDALLDIVGAAGETGEAAALALLALRARPARSPTRRDVTQLAILSVAFAALNGFTDGQALVASHASLSITEPLQGLWAALVNLDEILVAAGIWTWNMVRAPDETVRIHRAAALGILGLVVAGASYQAFVPGADPELTIMRGVIRTLGVGLLAYGVLRHDLAGLDEKVEFGVSRTTVAGVFVAVFFVVSEGAQVLLAGYANSEILGVLAAGALVFAISPLQRMADRFAARAVPGGAEAGAGAEERYRREVEMALADGSITREEERQLGRRAAELGIDAERALELREQVEADRDAEGDA